MTQLEFQNKIANDYPHTNEEINKILELSYQFDENRLNEIYQIIYDDETIYPTIIEVIEYLSI